MALIEPVTYKISIRKLALRIKRAYMKRKPCPALLIKGPPGMAKSAIMIALALELQELDAQFGACYVNGSNMQSVDMVGWPLQQNGILAANSIPTLFQPVPHLGLRGAFPAVHDRSNNLSLDTVLPYPRGLLIFDEASKVAGEDVMASLAMLAHEGRTGFWGVPIDGWVRVFIANRQEDNSNDLPFPATFDNRVAVFEVSGTYEDVAPHWEAIGMHPWWRGFASANASLVMAQSVPASGGQFSTIRSWTEAWYDCAAVMEHEIEIPHQHVYIEGTDEPQPKPWPCFYPDEETLTNILSPAQDNEEVKGWAADIVGTIASRCGSAVAGQFVDYVAHMAERATYEDIVSDPENAPIPLHSGVLHYTIEMLLQEIHLDDIDYVVRYLGRPDMPKALAAIWCQRMLRQHPFALTKRKAFTQFMNSIGPSARFALDGVD